MPGALTTTVADPTPKSSVRIWVNSATTSYFAHRLGKASIPARSGGLDQFAAKLGRLDLGKVRLFLGAARADGFVIIYI